MILYFESTACQKKILYFLITTTCKTQCTVKEFKQSSSGAAMEQLTVGRHDEGDTRQRQQEEESVLTTSAHHDKHEASTV